MKKNVVFLAPVSVIVLAVLILGLSILNDAKFNALEWVAAICGVLAGAWIVAMLMNIAVFGPVYWLLGRLQSRKDEKDTKHENDA